MADASVDSFDTSSYVFCALRRTKAVLSLLKDGCDGGGGGTTAPSSPVHAASTGTTFVVARKALPRDGHFNDYDMSFANISIPKYVDAGAEIENALAEAEENHTIFKSVASIPIEDVDTVYSHLLQLNKCYQAMAPNNKIVVFTDDMNVRKAFYALVYNSSRTGLVVDSLQFKPIGVLSATDFIMVLMKLWKFRTAITILKGGVALSEDECERTDISTMPISQWKEHLRVDGRLKEFQTIDINDSLYAAAARLADSRIHRMPVVEEETGDCMFLITHRRLLHFIWQHAALLPKPPYLRRSVKSLSIGTWTNLKYVAEETPLIDALDILINWEISGVPVLKDLDSMEVVDVYTRFDAISVAFSDGRFEDLSMKVQEALALRLTLTGRTEGVVTVPEDTDLWSLLEVFVKKNVHRIFAVDSRRRLKGLISLTDIINFLVLRQSKPAN